MSETTSDTLAGEPVELAPPIPMNVSAKLVYSEEQLLFLKQSPLVQSLPMLYTIDTSSVSPQIQRFGGAGLSSSGNTGNGAPRRGFRKHDDNERSYHHNNNHNNGGRRHHYNMQEEADSLTVEWDMPGAPGSTTTGTGGGGFFGLDDDHSAAPPAWLDSSEDTQKLGRGNVGHSIKEFEEWKQRKKVEELRKAGFEVPDPEPIAFEEDEDFFSTDNTTSTHASKTQNATEEPKPKNVDSMFGFWDSKGPESTGSGTSTNVAPSQAHRLDATSQSRLNPSTDSDHGSRFSRFFTPPQSQIQEQKPSAAAAPAPVPAQEDKEGFQRIMSMLGNSASPNQGLNPQQTPVQAQAHPQQQQQQPIQGNDNDLFFQSLLNKNKTEPAQPSPQQQQPQVPHTAPQQVPQQIPPQQAQKQQPQSQPQSQQQQQTLADPHQGNILPGANPNMLNLPAGFPPPPPGFPFPMPPPGMFLDKNGQPLPPEMLPYPPPPPPGMVFDAEGKPISYNGQPLPPLPLGVPPPFFGGPGPPMSQEHE